ncbi:twin-arginine translocase TatA/TatE family subunit [Patescibacteria group bacterium]|nr:twin-arginine translocase TatA/TatE family subunit [Patescibacteria group bacterium]
MLSGIGATEIVVVGLILLVLFGGKKLPELARGMGSSIKEFRKAASESA